MLVVATSSENQRSVSFLKGVEVESAATGTIRPVQTIRHVFRRKSSEQTSVFGPALGEGHPPVMWILQCRGQALLSSADLRLKGGLAGPQDYLLPSDGS